MKKTMKNQSKKFPLWGLKGLLSVALIGLGIAAFAQGAEVCQGTGYTIANAVEASPSSEYRWLENGNVLANTNQPTFDVPDNKAAGVYTYIRQSKSTDCPDWQSSNEFTVTVFDCAFTIPDPGAGATATFTDPRDGKQYKTVRMPDGRIWFAQNLNYTQGLTFNMYANEVNGKKFMSQQNGVLAIGSYWCPGADGSTYSGDQNTCNVLGALYTWETAMMVDGKYADETKTSSAWDELWVSPYYYTSGAYGTEPKADRNNARGGTYAKGGGRGICPKGWHISTPREWAIMLDKVDGDGNGTVYYMSNPSVAWSIAATNSAIKLKTTATYAQHPTLSGAWINANFNGTDDYNFTALAAGMRIDWRATHYGRGIYTQLLTSAPANAESTNQVSIDVSSSVCATFPYPRKNGNSVRCILD